MNSRSRPPPEARNNMAAVVAPLLIGRDNAQAAIGRPWRWCRDAAKALGVPVIVHGRTALIDAHALKDALLASGKLEQANDAELDGGGDFETPLPTSADDVLAALGKRRRSA